MVMRSCSAMLWIAFCLVFTCCDSGSEGGAPQGSVTGVIGQISNYSATNIVAISDSGGSGFSSSDNNGNALTVTIAGSIAPGTYSITNAQASGIVIYNFNSVNETYIGFQGQVIISSVDGNRFSGTYSFGARELGNASSTLTASGSFNDVRFGTDL